MKNYLKKAKRSDEFGCSFILMSIVAILLTIGAWSWMIYEVFMWMSEKQ